MIEPGALVGLQTAFLSHIRQTCTCHCEAQVSPLEKGIHLPERKGGEEGKNRVNGGDGRAFKTNAACHPFKRRGGEEKNANWRRSVNGGVGTARGEGGRKERRELSPPATSLT